MTPAQRTDLLQALQDVEDRARRAIASLQAGTSKNGIHALKAIELRAGDARRHHAEDHDAERELADELADLRVRQAAA